MFLGPNLPLCHLPFLLLAFFGCPSFKRTGFCPSVCFKDCWVTFPCWLHHAWRRVNVTWPITYFCTSSCNLTSLSPLVPNPIIFHRRLYFRLTAGYIRVQRQIIFPFNGRFILCYTKRSTWQLLILEPAFRYCNKKAITVCQELREQVKNHLPADQFNLHSLQKLCDISRSLKSDNNG